MRRGHPTLPGTRWTRARARAQTQQVRPQDMGDGLYRVESSRHGRFYEVCRDPTGHLTCSCPAGSHGRPCKHVAAVYGLGLREDQDWAAQQPWRAGTEHEAPSSHP